MNFNHSSKDSDVFRIHPNTLPASKGFHHNGASMQPVGDGAAEGFGTVETSGFFFGYWKNFKVGRQEWRSLCFL